MQSQPPVHYAAFTAYVVTSLVWLLLAIELSSSIRRRPQRRPMIVLALLTTLAMAGGFALGALDALARPALRVPFPTWVVVVWMLRDATVVVAASAFLHLTRHLGMRPEPPSRRWLAASYGVAAAVLVVSEVGFAAGVVAGMPAGVPLGHAVLFVYSGCTLGAGILRMRRTARAGAWRPGGMGEPSRADVIALAVVLVILGAHAVVFGSNAFGSGPGLDRFSVLLETVFGIGLALPLAMRVLGEFLRLLLLVGIGLLVASALVATLPVLQSAVAMAPWQRTLVDFLGAAAIVLCFGPGQTVLRAVLTRVLLRRGHARHAWLLEVARTLEPELGSEACTERALSGLVNIMGLRGAAMRVAGLGRWVVVGDVDTAPLDAVWPRGAAAARLPSEPYGGGAFGDLPPKLSFALSAADVTGIVPVSSPRRRWGDVFLVTGPLGASYTAEDVRAVMAFAAQLALSLDAAELLSRIVRVERALAHAEKLAAIGETAARIAHDVRNPVTAARSLAQQLAREPDAPYAAELGIILDELERVERHVASLLRFARREERHVAPEDLGALARAALAPMTGRLAAAGVSVVLDAPARVVAPVDAEQMRQVIANLVDNAADAVAAAAPPRRIEVSVARVDGHARLRVADTGPGVTADALPRLFEPFFSLKPSGTGLGLAIARRTVETHGGRIVAEPVPGAGLAVTVELPLEETAG